MLYWFISAQSVKSIQETRGWLGGNGYSIFYLIGFLVICNFKFLGRLGIPVDLLSTLLLPSSMITSAIVTLSLSAGLILAIFARRTLASNWSGMVALKKGHELITTGPYHYVRHPIYTGMLLMILGTALSIGTLGACIGFLIILFGSLLKLKQEEALLTEHFAQEYLLYKQHTKRLIPFLW